MADHKNGSFPRYTPSIMYFPYNQLQQNQAI